MALNVDLNKLEKRNVSIQLPKYIPVIAEIGINHNGSLETAKKLIDIAVETGCDAVKFQKRTIDIVYSQEVLDAPRESPWGTTQRDQKEGLEFSREDYQEIDSYCKEKSIDWSASAWDLESLDFVESFNPPFHKVASAMLTHESFIEKVASFGRLTLVSTGMADLEMIRTVVEVFKNHKTPIILLHTVSTYPTPLENLNISAMLTLAETFGLPVGYSGHEASVSPSFIAASLGAVVIERHITFDRAAYGSDQSASLEENGLRNLVNVLRKIPVAMGSGEIDWAPGEREVAAKLRYWETN